LKIERFEDIEAWRLAREITIAIYRATDGDGFSRDFGLRDQVRRAAGSIMHNIAEGFDAGGNAEFIRFLNYAKRSCTEVQSELYVALDRHYLTQQEFNALYDQVRLTRAKIGAFIKYLSRYESEQNPTRRPRQPRTVIATLNREP
jgi:four helix bundle protein